MPKIDEGKLTFIFPDDWHAEKLDDTAFYRKHFQSFANSKCVDIVAFKPKSDTLWLIEIRDYRGEQGENIKRQKTIDLFTELSYKVRDTLANLYLAQRKPEISIYDFAKLAGTASKIKVVLHLEKYSHPYTETTERYNAPIKLAETVRVVDPHPWLCKMSKMPPNCPWKVLSKDEQSN